MKKEKIHIITIPVPLYRMSVVIFIGGGVDDFVKHGLTHHITKDYFTEEWKKWVKEHLDGLGLMADYGQGSSDVLVWLKVRPDRVSNFAVLYHELYHAVDQISKSRGFDNKTSENCEPRAYLFEYLFTEASKVLWKIK